MSDSKALWGLIGVLLGWLLNELTSFIKQKKHICNLRKALKEECKSILAQIPQLIDIFQQCIKNLEQGRILPGQAVRSISNIYNSTIMEFTPHLSLKERNLLHVVHERLRVGDDILANYVSLLSKELKDKLIEDPISGWILRMKDQIDSYNIAANLINSYLAGKPIDVFYVNKKK